MAEQETKRAGLVLVHAGNGSFSAAELALPENLRDFNAALELLQSLPQMEAVTGAKVGGELKEGAEPGKKGTPLKGARTVPVHPAVKIVLDGLKANQSALVSGIWPDPPAGLVKRFAGGRLFEVAKSKMDTYRATREKALAAGLEESFVDGTLLGDFREEAYKAASDLVAGIEAWTANHPEGVVPQEITEFLGSV